jgi:predicted 3-demethylubiquinone-9 3-methyltransferase (glyoxalase superfamily)
MRPRVAIVDELLRLTAREFYRFSYVSVFPASRITNATTLHDTPSGDTDLVTFEVAGRPFMAISAGPLFKFNPSVSFQVRRRTKGDVDALWNSLGEGRAVLPRNCRPLR